MQTSSDAPAPAAKPKGRQIYKMRVTEVRDYTPSIRELFLQCEEPSTFEFRAGQFVMLHVPVEGGKPALRAYSIATPEHRKDGYRLIFKWVDKGLASEYVWKLKGGEVLDFTGPFGRVFFNEPPTQQIIMLNTGSGISQHMSFLDSHAEKYPDLRYRLFFGVRREEDVYYRDELEAMKKRLKNFEYYYVLSRSTETWKGKRGYVQEHVDDCEHLKIPTTFYLCGNGAMIKDVNAKLAAENFDPKLIFAEAFD